MQQEHRAKSHSNHHHRCRFLISLDDTDETASRGTGFRGRQLARWLALRGLATTHSISRHQLCRASGIPYTSHNSAVCLEVEAKKSDRAILETRLAYFVGQSSAPASDPGYSLAELHHVDDSIKAFGKKCKQTPVTLDHALAAAASSSVSLQSMAGPGRGRIGALAALGLRASGADGRFIWLPGLRSLHGIFRLQELEHQGGILAAQTASGQAVDSEDRIMIRGWVRPLLRGHQPVLFVKRERSSDYEWRILDKGSVKELDS